MSKVNNFLNTISILTTLLILVLCYWARLELPPYVTTLNYFSLFALASTLFILPDFLCFYFPGGYKWFRTSEFYTGVLVLLLGICGLILASFVTLTDLIILPIGIALAFWQIFQFVRDKSYLSLPAGFLFILLLVLMFYMQNHHNLLFPERIILGKAHIDILFHSSMSNMFSTLGWASTGLNGSPYIPYHWGFHALMAGLKNWTGLSTLMFNNIGYPAIFLPLFFKSLFNFVYRLFSYKGFRSFNLLFVISFMIFLYSLPVTGFMNSSPVISESLCIALLFTFLYGSTLFCYVSDSPGYSKLFLLYSLLTLIFLSFLKISVGSLCFVGLAYLYLRTKPDIRSLLLVVASGIIIAAFIFIVVFDPSNVATPVSLPNRIKSFWLLSVSFFTYFTGAIIAIIVVMKSNSLKNWQEFKSVLRSKEYLDLEVLFIITLFGVFAGIYASGFAHDVYYFCVVQMFISIPYLILYAQKYFDRFRSNETIKTVFIYFVVILSFISRPGYVTGLNRITRDKIELRRLSKQQQVMQSFLPELFKLEKESDKKNKCIYIPQTEKWYYESQTYKPFGAPFVVPAISGISMIGAVPDTILKSDNSHGYYYYKKNGQLMASNINEAKIIAIKKGYHELIFYHLINDRLDKQVFILNLQNQYSEE